MKASIEWAIEWVDDHLEVIDQTKLPGEVVITSLHSVDDVVDAIQRLVVRGAPAIGVCGAFGVVIGLRAGEALVQVAERIASARPTAVNLATSVARVVTAANLASPADAVAVATTEACRVRDEDRESCRLIGEHGRTELASVTRVLTHCNTGRLATAGIGTALGVVYAKAEAGEPIAVLATETRPLLQGARLTAWELANAGIPVTLIADTAAGAALASGRVEAVIVGCDRVARNGDVANKIGTYAIAVLARANGVPFYVAGPMSSFDPACPDGDAIVIEERDPGEVLRPGGSATVVGVEAWNPAFDVTPSDLITAFITDAGVLRPPFAASITAALAAAHKGHAVR
jgi:methylthioribose-1-phosphate isomerase